MYSNYQPFNNISRPNIPPMNNNYNSQDRIAGGFLGPFILGGITGGLVAPAFYPRPYQRPYYPGPYYGRPPYYY